MQNKGFVKVIAAAFALICLFYLSFSIVSSYYKGKGEDLYGEGTPECQAYLDSLSGEKVWLGYTLKECREKELNLGLDLKGGMNVVMEVSVADILTSLAGTQSESEAFVKAMKLAKEKQLTNQRDFVDLFAEAHKEVNAGLPLTSIFSSYEMRDKIETTFSDDEVVEVLKREVESTIDNSFNVLRSRIDRFGVVQPNIQRLEVAGRILIEMPGVKEPERVRKLLQGSANLEFWETYNLSELFPALEAVNNMARGMVKIDTPATSEDTTAAVASADTAASSALDSLMLASAADTVAVNKDAEKWASENPFYSIVQLRVDPQTGRALEGPCIGYVHMKDTAKVTEYFRLAQERKILPNGFIPKWSVKAIDEAGLWFELIALHATRRDGKAPLDGSVIVDANADYAENTSASVVNMEMDDEGAQIWARLTKENKGRCIAIVLDNYVYSYPSVNAEIVGGRSEISGRFTVQEAKDLANVLKCGKMPAPAHIVQEDVVGPSLGQEAINAGLISFIAAFILVLLYMILYYGLVPGLVADVALLCNVFFIFSVLASFGAVLTLPGIAGIVLTLGMAVDANVLIYERTREELRAGKGIKKALADGYKNAFSAIIDSNLTTVLTGIVLFVFGTGPIKGFATTLIIGIFCSFFTAVFISRLIFEWLLEKNNKYQDLKFVTKITENWFQDVKFDFLAKRNTFFLISGAILLVCLGSLFVNGMKKGVDFSGGRNFIVRFEQPVSAVEVSDLLKGSFEESSLSVITIGKENQLRITTNYKINENDRNVDAEIEGKVYNGVKSLLNEGVSQDMFLNRYVVENGVARISTSEDSETFGLQSSQKVGPTMADDIKTSAIWAVLLSLIGIGLYILARFRNVSFSLGAVIALVHDTLFIFGLFSLLQNVMPFSMEIDQSFIAAILTVIGYSINDKVVIFDRIREMFNLHPRAEASQVINSALRSTLSRTFSTSVSTLVVLVVIFFFGGETIRGFIFAMLMGVIVGTYSSWFVATPLAYIFLKKFKKNDEVKEVKSVK
jgi:SecD/SecF fusion protein